LARTIQRHPRVDRCHLEFRESIYGARRYDHPWLLPFLGRVIWLADSIRLSGRIVGIDKINHFIREGLSHWRAAGRPGGDIADVLARELGSPARRWSMTERGLKGLALTGVLSYADLAASYAGYRYWRDLLSLDGPGAYVGRDARSGQYVQRRRVTFADYVTDAWDEAINCSAFLPAAARDVRIALGRRGLQCPVTDCRTLAALPSAALYVNPACRSAAAADTYRTTRAAPIVQ
jgi:hypothetical protein